MTATLPGSRLVASYRVPVTKVSAWGSCLSRRPAPTLACRYTPGCSSLCHSQVRCRRPNSPRRVYPSLSSSQWRLQWPELYPLAQRIREALGKTLPPLRMPSEAWPGYTATGKCSNTPRCRAGKRAGCPARSETRGCTHLPLRSSAGAHAFAS